MYWSYFIYGYSLCLSEPHALESRIRKIEMSDLTQSLHCFIYVQGGWEVSRH